jgi:hypothetical protein
MASPRARRGISKALAVLVIGGIAVWYVGQRLDHWMYPWADTTSGRPVLLGSWVGQLTTGGKRPRVVWMEIVREQRPRATRHRRCRGCDDGIEGTLRTCDERGRIWQYRLSGTPEDRAVTRLQGSTQPIDSPPPDGLSLSSFRGSWDGADALNLEVQFYWRKGASAITSSADPDTQGWVPLPLRRNTKAEFTARCKRIAGPAIAERELVP